MRTREEGANAITVAELENDDAGSPPAPDALRRRERSREPRVVDVLLIEDSPDDAELTLRALARVSPTLRVVHYDDGVRALEFLNSLTAASLPRFVLLDLKLPKVDGLELLRWLKSSPVTRGVPVVVLTSSSEEADLRACYELGVNSYLVKPIDFERYMSDVSAAAAYWGTLNRLPRQSS